MSDYLLEQVFDRAHIFHARTVDVLASTKLTDAEKEAEIDKLYNFYLTKVSYAITGLPMKIALRGLVRTVPRAGNRFTADFCRLQECLIPSA